MRRRRSPFQPATHPAGFDRKSANPRRRRQQRNSVRYTRRMQAGASPARREPFALGALLRGWRIQAGLSREQLAERAGLSPQAIGAIEQGMRRRPYPHTLAALAEALELA